MKESCQVIRDCKYKFPKKVEMPVVPYFDFCILPDITMCKGFLGLLSQS